ncbi:hypothetical protein [Desulfovibrio sp. ZJ369]|uniref:hypothetical protein n=1 Tax=Desulfovibrio sp. ZJ369 TaxID=2709793 RepID=UPI0013EAB3AC|nr:hypothetical protein [Desulfovibrio sp. ZJ369]
MTFYESQRWHSGEKRGFRLNVRRVAAAAAFASAEHFQRENALEHFAFEIIQFQKRRCHHSPQAGQVPASGTSA